MSGDSLGLGPVYSYDIEKISPHLKSPKVIIGKSKYKSYEIFIFIIYPTE
jgi:hypothetical protein